MYDYKVISGKPRAKTAVLLLLLLAVLLFVASGMLPHFRVLLQCLGLCAFFPCVQITARYLAQQYLYRLRSYDDGNVDFEIYTYRGGARMQLVCRVGLEEITAVTALGEANKKPPRGMRRYAYNPDMRPKSATVLSITNGDGDCEVLICPDEYLARVFEDAAKRNSENREEN